MRLDVKRSRNTPWTRRRSNFRARFTASTADDGHGATRMAIALMMHEKADGSFHDTCLVLNFRPKVPGYYPTEPLATSDHLPTLYESSAMGSVAMFHQGSGGRAESLYARL